MLNKKLLKDSLGWGFILWLIGYILGFALFFAVPPFLIGWIIMPIGIIVTFWVLIKKVKVENFRYFFILAIVWTLTALALDYLLIVKALKPADGYYKLAVYLYYGLTFAMPLIAYWWKKTKASTANS